MKKIIKRFKKLTLFDKAIVLLVVLGAIFFLYIFFRKSEHITVTVKVGEEDIRSLPWMDGTGSRIWFRELFYEGMTEKDGLGRINAEVINIYSYDISPSKSAIYLTIKLKSIYSRATDQYSYKGTSVLIGAPIEIFLDRLQVDGLVTHIEGVKDPRERETLIVEARLVEENPTFQETSGVDDYLAEVIKVGDVIRDNQGQAVIKIIDKRVERAKKVVTTSDGRVLVQLQPFKQDVYLTLEVQAIKISNKYFVFDDVPIVVSWDFPIVSSKYSIWPEVTEFAIAE